MKKEDDDYKAYGCEDGAVHEQAFRYLVGQIYDRYVIRTRTNHPLARSSEHLKNPLFPLRPPSLPPPRALAPRSPPHVIAPPFPYLC